MCGIVGIPARNTQIPPAVLEHATRSLAHRGPDDSGTVLLKDAQPEPLEIGLGHRRLAILDLSLLGHQPMQDPVTGNWIVFNGEIYNFRELRKELEAAAVEFKSHYARPSGANNSYGGTAMQPTRSFTFSCLALVVLIALSGYAFSTTVAVGTCTTLVHFATIQLAVNSVPAGSIIKVCPGTYHEQVVIIDKNLTLEGIASPAGDAAVILPPATGLVANTADVDTDNPIAAQLLVQNAGPVSISNLTVDGTGNAITGCSPDLQGILFQNATGTVKHVAVRNQVPNGIPKGCQIGESIYVQTAAGHSSTVTVENSSVHNYNKNGITGNDAGTALTVTGNYVQGAGVVPSGGAAQNGIQLGFGATGTIKSNTVIDNIYGDPTVAASANILLYDTAENSGITVTSNRVGNSQLPIALITLGDDGANLGDGVTVTDNHIFGTSAYDAIDVCTNGNTVTGNTIFNSAESGVHLDASCGIHFGGTTGNNNIATGNTIVESACAGILADTGTTGNTTTPNTYFTVPFPVTSSAASCTIPPGPTGDTTLAGPTRTKTARKFSPAR
jgi:hypothetical protein